MPTSGGGGGHGGGFSGGGFSGGHGGGFHGGRGFRGGSFFFFGPRFGLFGLLSGPIFALIMVSIMMVVLGGMLFSSIGEKKIDYSSDVAFDYAMERYDEAFSKGSVGYEDKILLIFFTNDGYTEYDYYTMNGDHLTNAAYGLMRDDRSSALTSALERNISQTGYKDTLGRNLSCFVDDMAVEFSGISNPFTCSEDPHVNGPSQLVNRSELAISAELVNASLKTFTEQTGIQFVIVVDDAAAVFGYERPSGLIFALIFLLVFAIVVIVSMVGIVKNWKKNKQNKNDPGNSSGGQTAGAQTDQEQKNSEYPNWDNW